MITKDNTFNKHQHCEVDGFWITNKKIRLRCIHHNKWLHTLTSRETDFLIKSGCINELEIKGPRLDPIEQERMIKELGL